MKRYGIWFIGALLVTMFALPINSYAAKPYTVEKTYTTSDPGETMDFDKEIKVNGKTYRLSGVENEVLDDNAKEESIVITSPAYVDDNPDYIPIPVKYHTSLGGKGTAAFGGSSKMIRRYQTGDQTPYLLMIGLFVFSVAGIGFLLYRRQKK